MPARMIIAWSDAFLRVERRLLAVLVAAVTGLVLLNVVTRAFNMALFWVDELAIYTMVWMVLIGVSTMVREKTGIAVTILFDALGDRAKRWLGLTIDVVVLGFSVALLALCWRWYDPPGLVSAGFDTGAFSGETFNFIYQEPTNTLGVRKWIIWLVVPLVSISLTVHSLANVLQSINGVRGYNEE
ncbi:MAG: TRAP transporter small permease subunit [Gammaproteobacteria bacterium]|nr:TRAP transporter small permease subunit [Gammaproteobacteria bacterium]